MSLTACNITRVVPEGKQLLVANKIQRTEAKNIDLSDERNSIKQKPNRELLGFIKFHLWAYQYGNKGLGIRKKQPWLRRLAEKVGEAPVLIDSNKMAISATRLSDYYFSEGFFDNTVSYTVVPKKLLKKRATVTYNVKLGSYHTINTLVYHSPSRVIEELLATSSDQQKIKVGQRLDFEKIEAERARINDLLKNTGFYYFNSSFIDFQVDTNQVKHKADVVVNIRNKKNLEPHYQQTISKISVLIGDATSTDTLYFKGLQFIEGSYYIKPLALSKSIILRPGDIYDASKVQKTYSNLLSMGLFNFVTIRFVPAQNDSLHKLEAQITLQTAPKHDFIWEPQAILTGQSGGIQADNLEQSFGVANNLTLANRNVFGGAETFNITSLTALETQLKKDGQQPVNSFRQSINAELVIPSLLYFERKHFSKVFVKKSTKFNASYLHEQNVNFTRNVIPFSFTYAFTKGKFSYGVTPLRLSINQALVEPGFLASLDLATQTYTNQLLTNNIILGPTASFYWTNKNASKSKYWQVRSNAVELSGNLVDLYFNLFTDETGPNKEINGVKYSQYVRSDIDVTYNHVIDENNAWACRFYTGAGLPYGNTLFLPFERRFFVGGGNNLRAWRPRTIGPGSYSDNTTVISIEKTGEFSLVSSAEFRFDIIDKYVDGAVFVDAGNIWTFKDEPNFENGQFQFNRFYKEIALNSGLGLRFDLTYVVFRTDWGIALHDPSKVETQRWVIKDFSDQRWVFDNTAVNFAIGFPF